MSDKDIINSVYATRPLILIGKTPAAFSAIRVGLFQYKSEG
jgi:hypothetical protein